MRLNQSVNGEDEDLNGEASGEPSKGIADLDQGANPRIHNSIHGSAWGEMEAILAQNAPEPVRVAPTASQDLGPCFYFGPAGQRCDRRAVHDGFCARHQPVAATAGPTGVPTAPEASAASGTSAASAANRKKVMAAAIAIIGILLPYLIDLLRELARLFPR